LRPPPTMRLGHVPDPFNARERALLDRLTSPGRVQAFLDSIPYSAEPVYRSPRSVMRDRKAHCFDGALFAAAALRRIGHRPLLVDLRAVRDDDHVIAVFKVAARLGAVAKSNVVGLRFREPIFRNVRELAASYFESYYNVVREKTLRSFSTPVDLRAFDALGWMTTEAPLDRIVQALDRARHTPLAGRAALARLIPIDDRSYAAGLLGANEAGLYRPRS
jgi:hypothetical protein